MNFKYLFVLCIIFLFTSCVKDEFYNKQGSNKENFNLLWKIIDESYCYFDYKHINWDSVYTVYAPKVSNDLSKYEFFDICKKMLQELRDGHVNLISDFDVMTYKDFYLDYPQNYNEGIIERHYLGKDFIYANWFKSKNIRNIGYIRYNSFMNIVSRKNLEEAIYQLGNIQGLIIDVRNNSGGYINMVDTIASCFCSSDITTGYIRYKTGKGHNDFRDFKPKILQAHSKPLYNGNIVVLTNRGVYSSANDFISSMKCLDNVTIIGDKTGGGGGAPFTSELYNGWQVINSRNPLFDKNKQHIEFGIDPDIKVDMNPTQETSGIDSIIEYAIDYLLKLK